MNIFEVIKKVKELSQIDISTDFIKGHELCGAWLYGSKGMHVSPSYNERVDREAIFLYTDILNDVPLSFSVLFHELAHASGESSRLNRRGIGYDRPFYNSRKGNCLEEQIAETTALKLMNHFKLSTSETIQKTENYLKIFSYSGVDNMFIDAEFYSKIASNKDAFEREVETESDRAFNYILAHWLIDFDPKCVNERLEQRYKEFNKFF